MRSILIPRLLLYVSTPLEVQTLCSNIRIPKEDCFIIVSCYRCIRGSTKSLAIDRTHMSQLNNSRPLGTVPNPSMGAGARTIFMPS
jgi:hypothetical protein